MEGWFCSPLPGEWDLGYLELSDIRNCAKIWNKLNSNSICSIEINTRYPYLSDSKVKKFEIWVRLFSYFLEQYNQQNQFFILAMTNILIDRLTQSKKP